MEWILLGSVSAVAIIAGVAWHRPHRVGPWLLLAAAVGSLAIGDVFYALDNRGTADLFYLVMFAVVALSLLQLTRGGSVLVDRAHLIDMLAFTCSALLVVWVFVIGTSGQLGSISAADVIGDTLLLGVAGRTIKAAGRNWSAILLATGAAGMLVSDILYPLSPGTLTETGYIVLYVAWGLAALLPSMKELTQPVPALPRPWDGRWAALLGLSVVTPPLVLLIEAASGTVRDGIVIAAASGITLMLTIARLSDSVAQHSQALSRERGLREASAALVAAADVPAVDHAVRSAIAQLMPAQAIHQVTFATDDREVTLEAIPLTDAGLYPRSWWVDAPRAEGAAPTATLVCPLWLEPLAVARPNGGALVLVGRRDFLTVTRDALEVLAGQAALALDRICLVEAVGRRDSDLYLRAVIRNDADVMLVIDEDQRIRYASPALSGLIGADELPPLATLHDLVHPDDRVQVRQAFQSEGDGVVFCALQRPDDSQVLVEATYRDLRADRLVQGFVVTLRTITRADAPSEQTPRLERIDELPAWVNRRSAQHKFRY